MANSSTSTEETTLLEGMVYLIILVLLMICFNLLIRLARLYAQQRPIFTKADPEFRNKEKHQNWNWDWVMVFRIQGADEIVTRYQEHYSLRRIVERLNGGGLETKLYKSYDFEKIFCKIRCNYERLKNIAANTGYRLLMKEKEVQERMQNGFRDDQGIVWKGRQIIDEKNQCPSYEYYEFIYGKYDKREQLQSLYEEYPASNSIFRGVDRIKLIMSIMEADIKDEGCSLKLRDLIAKGAILAIFPLHDDLQLHALQNQWLSYFAMPHNQPIETIKDYYGEKVGMYFLFLGHYASWLLYAGIIGIVVFLCENLNEYYPFLIWATLFMCIFISLWTTFFLTSWRHKQSTATMEWGMTGYEELERERTAFIGKLIHSPINGMPIQYFPPGEKAKRIILSYLQVILCMLYVATINAGIFYIYAYISRYPYQDSLAFSFFPKNYNLPLILTFLTIATVTTISNEFFMPFASHLNTIENHVTDTQFEDNLILKVFLFQFVNSYGALFYIILFKGPIPDEIGLIEPWRTRRFSCRPLCFHEAGALLGTIFLVRVILGNILEVVVPYLKMTKRNHQKTDPNKDTNEYDDPFDTEIMRKRQISPAEEQFQKADYDSISLFNDYAELVIQYGYTTLFATAFPLAPLFACANNIIEIRVDGWKLTQNTRRPWPSGAEDIGTWEDVLHLMSVIATVTNALIVSFLSPIFDALTTIQRILIFIGLEFILLGLMLALFINADDSPQDVQIQLDRQEFYASKIILNKRDEEPEDYEDDEKEDIDQEPIIFSSDPQIIDEASIQNKVGAINNGSIINTNRDLSGIDLDDPNDDEE